MIMILNRKIRIENIEIQQNSIVLLPSKDDKSCCVLKSSNQFPNLPPGLRQTGGSLGLKASTEQYVQDNRVCPKLLRGERLQGGQAGDTELCLVKQVTIGVCCPSQMN